MSKIEDLANLPGSEPVRVPAPGSALPPLHAGVEPPLLTDPVQPAATRYAEPPPAAASRATIADTARGPATPTQRFPLPYPPPDRGAALGQAIEARGGQLPPTPSGGTVRTQMGVREAPVTALPPTQPAPAQPSTIAEAAGAELPTVERNPLPSAPANNQISNPNMRLVPGSTTGSNYVSDEGLAYQKSGAGNKIPDQVGNPKLNPVPPQGVPPADGWPKRVAGRGAPVPNMPSSAEPVTNPTQRVVPPAGEAGGAAPGAGGAQGAPGSGGAQGAGAAAAQGRYGRIADAASKAVRAAVPESLGGTPVATSSTLLNNAVRAARWVGPAIEAGQVAKVALDRNSSKADVAEQAAVGVGRGASALAGAGLGGAAGSVLGPAGSFLGGVAGGAAGYWGGDQAIRKLRSVFGLDERTPSERTDARSAARAASATKPPAKPAATVAQAAAQAAAPQPGQVAGAPASAVAPAAPGGTDALAARYQALQDQQLASPVAFTLIGNGGGTEVYYKNGDVVRLGRGEAVPQEVAQYHALSDQLHALRTGQAPAAAAPQAPLTPPVTSAQNSPIQQSIVAEAQRQGYDPQLALAKISLETGGKFNTDAKNPTSSAAGLGQMLAANRAKYGTEEQWKDPAFQISSSIDFMKKNDADLAQRLGHAPNLTESYLGHLLGPQGGAALLRANQDLPIEQVVAGFQKNKNLARQIIQNNGMAGLTAGQAVDKWDQLLKQHAAGVGQPPAAQAALPVADGAIPDYRRETPVGLIEGPLQIDGLRMPAQRIRSYVEMPMPGGGYARVPRSIMDEGLAAGNARGAVQDYMANYNAGLANELNPAKAKLDEQAIQTGGAVAGHQIAADAETKRAAITAAAGKQRYVPVGGGIDPDTGMAKPQNLFDTASGRLVDLSPKTYPIPSGEAIDELKKSPHLAPEFDAMFGPGAAKKAIAR